MSTPPPLPDDPFITTGAPPVAEGGYQMAPVSDDVSAQPKPTACVACGAAEFSTRTEMPVCEPCRTGLVRFPFPRWVKLAAAGVALMVMVSLAMSRERLMSARHMIHAQRMLHAEKWEEAYQEYHSVIAGKDDTEMLLDYAQAALNSGHWQDAAEAMNSLAGRQVSKMELSRANALLERLETTALRPAAGVPPPLQLNTSSIQIQPSGQLNSFELQQTPPGSLNNGPIQLQTR